MPSILRRPLSTGIGLRLPHIEEAVATRPSVGWLEIHPENFIVNPHATELLCDLTSSYPISVHTVGLSVGSATGLDRQHLARVRALVDRVNPVRLSGHLAWSTHGSEYLNDLLPLPYDEETLRIVCDQLAQAQDGLGRSFLLENPSSYVGFVGSTMTEVQFLNELVDRAGCRLLCDVSNIHVSSHNMGYDARAYIDGLPIDAIDEIHLGGFTREDDDATSGADILIDTHATRIAHTAWELYAYAVRRWGHRPTLIEWDNDIPALSTLLEEAYRADAIVESTCQREPCDVAC
jgi:uncharacterized protein (UPF0276 family)